MACASKIKKQYKTSKTEENKGLNGLGHVDQGGILQVENHNGISKAEDETMRCILHEKILEIIFQDLINSFLGDHPCESHMCECAMYNFSKLTKT